MNFIKYFHLSTFNNDKFKIIFTLVIAFLYLTAVSLQGFDLSDEGYALSFYQQFFDNPDSVQSNFIFYLAGILGGIWQIVFGWGGYFSFRLLNVFVILLTALATYKIVEEYINPIIFLIATFCAIFLSNYGNIVFHHNNFTSLLVSISLLFLIPGIAKNKKWSIFLSGFVIGLTFFARIANVTLISLSLLFVLNFFYDKNWSLFWKNILFFASGCFVGIIFILVTMGFLGHLNIFFESINENILNAGVNENSTHSLKKLLITYLKEYLSISKFLIFYFLLFVSFVFLFKFFQKDDF